MHLQEVYHDLAAGLFYSTLLSSFIYSYTQIAHGSHQPFFIII